MKRALTIFAVACNLLSATTTKAQIITLFAGTPDNAGYTGDGGQATAAMFYSPSDIAFDRAGNLYVTDFINNVIRKIDTFGIVRTVAGNGFGAGSTTTASGGYTGDGGPATAAELNGPFALAIDRTGNIIFADGYNHVVRKVSTSGIITTIAGNNTAAYNGDGGPATAAALNNPVGIALDTAGNIYIADDHNNAVRKVDAAGIMTTFAGNHTAGYSGDGGPASAAAINDPIGVGVDKSGNVYIADAGNNSVRKVNTAGIISTFAGNDSAGYSGDGGGATAAQLRSPERIFVDDTGNVYISDFFNNVVRKVSPSGIISTFAGIGTGAGTGGTAGAYSGDGGPATAAELWVPSGVAMDYYGRIYICDRGNEIIRRVGPAAPIDHSGVKQVAGGIINLNIYPNPVRDGGFTVKLVTKLPSSAEITITNMLGQIILSTKAATNTAVQLKLNAPPGVYILSAVTAEGKCSSRLLVE